MTNISLDPNSSVFAQVQNNMQPQFNSPAAQDINTTNTLEKTPKTDTITIAGKTIKKKTAIIGGLGVLAAAAAIGAAVVFGKRKPPVVPSELKIPPEANPVAEVAEVTEAVTEAVTGKAEEVVDNFQKEAQELADSIQKDAQELADSVKKEAKDVLATVQKKIDELTEIFKNGGKDAEGNVVAEIIDNPKNIGGKDYTFYDMVSKSDANAGTFKSRSFRSGEPFKFHVKNGDGSSIDCDYGNIIYYDEAGRKSFRFNDDGLYRYASYPENSTVGVLDSLSFDKQGNVIEYKSFSGKYGELEGVTAYFDFDGKVRGLREGSNKIFTFVDGKWEDLT